ncbi:GIY-YIG nuclease family protein [Flavonifractor plautii]|nr:GIY-YIG nuclease family protein [Flavonifractor plautii]
MSWWVYILRCGDKTLYTGTAADVERRLAAHRRGRGAKYTRGRGPLAVVYREECPDQGAALRREAAIKKVPAGGKGSIDFGLCGKAEQDEKSGIYRNGKHGRAPDSGGVPGRGGGAGGHRQPHPGQSGGPGGGTGVRRGPG